MLSRIRLSHISFERMYAKPTKKFKKLIIRFFESFLKFVEHRVYYYFRVTEKDIRNKIGR